MSVSQSYIAVHRIRPLGKLIKPGQDVPELSQELTAALLERNAIKASSKVLPVANDSSTDELSELEKVLAVIPDVISNKDNLTSTGAPSTAALTEAVGFDVSAELRNQAWSAYQAAQGAE